MTFVLPIAWFFKWGRKDSDKSIVTPKYVKVINCKNYSGYELQKKHKKLKMSSYRPLTLCNLTNIFQCLEQFRCGSSYK